MHTLEDLHRMLGISGNIGFAMVSPNLAKLLLENNTKNRRLSEKKARSLTKRFENGEYFVSPDCIAFDEKGILVNGQHRLYAISLLSSGSYKLGVMFNIQQKMDLDTGSKRKLEDNALIFDGVDSRFKERTICLKVAKDLCCYATGSYSYKELSQKQLVEIANSLADDLITCYDEGLFDKNKNVSSLPLFSAFYLAYVNGVSLDVLKHIKATLKEGNFPTKKDKPIKGLFFRLAKINGGGREPGLERFLLSCECIYRVSRGLTSEGYPSLEKLEKSNWRYIKKDIMYISKKN